MRNTVLIALLFIAAGSINTRASAQTAYKCGNTYSQSPCPGGVAIEASDSRTPAEKAQRDALTENTARRADQMEKNRLGQEKKSLAANASVPPALSTQATAQANAPKDKASAPRTAKKPKLIHPEKRPEGFVAVVPGTPKPHKPKTKKKVGPSAATSKGS